MVIFHQSWSNYEMLLKLKDVLNQKISNIISFHVIFFKIMLKISIFYWYQWLFWPKMVKKWSKLVKKWSKLVKNWSKLVKMSQNWSKIGHNCSKLVKKIWVFSGEDFLDWARPLPPLMKKIGQKLVKTGQKLVKENLSIFW